MKEETSGSAPTALAALCACSVLSSTMLIPAVRPFMAGYHHAPESAVHAFMTVNMLGAIVGAPLLAWWADRLGDRNRLLVVLAVVDGALLLACTAPLSVGVILVLRAAQGAANVGGLSILMGGVRGGDPKTHGRTMGLIGAAIMAAVALGAPVGTLLLSAGRVAPVLVGGLLQLGVAGYLLRLRGPRTARTAPPVGQRPTRERLAHPLRLLRETPLLRLPTSWVTAERFTVGTFVVSFALYGHRALDLSDTEVGVLFSWFMLPFALATYPLSRLAERVPRAALVAGGTGLYGLSFIWLGLAPTGWLWLVMLTAGLSSAAIYAPSLCYAATLAPASARSMSMALLNAGGSLGMMLGTATAGVASALLTRAGWAPEEIYPAIFAGAGLLELMVLGLSAPGLMRLARRDSAEVLAGVAAT